MGVCRNSTLQRSPNQYTNNNNNNNNDNRAQIGDSGVKTIEFQLKFQLRLTTVVRLIETRWNFSSSRSRRCRKSQTDGIAQCQTRTGPLSTACVRLVDCGYVTKFCPFCSTPCVGAPAVRLRRLVMRQLITSRRLNHWLSDGVELNRLLDT